jgi:RNA polymerase sigma-70 factor (ECF subfamily)
VSEFANIINLKCPPPLAAPRIVIYYRAVTLFNNRGDSVDEQDERRTADLQLVAALRAGDEAVFNALIDQLYNSMVRIAMIYTSDQAVAEDVVQETWIAVLRGLDRFEGRSSLKTWIFTILTNRAKTRAQREGRYVPLELPDETDAEPAVESERFNVTHHWRTEAMPGSWENIPEDRLLARETQQLINAVIDALPPNQREVIRLRDIEDFTSAEVCNILNISETNQRVLLHRARSKVRRALESYLSQ